MEGRAEHRTGGSVGLPRADLPPWQRALRYSLARLFVKVVAGCLIRLRLEGRENIVSGPALYCFNHLGWTDPPVILATFPGSVRLYFYGPKEETLARGARNRIMWWTGVAVPFRPEKDDLLTSVKRAEAVFDSGASLAIAGEGAIHLHEGDLLPLQEGAAYLALRAGVPIVPVAITGTSWIGFRRLVRVRVGRPIPTGVRPTHEAIREYTWRTWHALRAMVADDRDLPIPGRFGRWLTDVFNDWGPGGRAHQATIVGPRPGHAPFADAPWAAADPGAAVAVPAAGPAEGA
ncbi:MAG TPA: lysophospholipid acyltransferase family protein [Candidatus Binatus sp.]|nr:lysophospholipid acyltransferase family protein [Candidatus Binatus sp.]